MLYLLYHNGLKRSILKLFTNNKMSGPPHPCPLLKTGGGHERQIIFKELLWLSPDKSL
jgi:hypothetical protein